MKHFCNKTIISIVILFLFFGNIINLCSADTIWSDSEITLIKEHAGRYGTSYDMVLDSNGTIHIIYQDSVSENEVFYLKKTRCDNWSDHEYIFTGGQGHHLYIDNKGTLHLIWYEGENIVKDNLVLYWKMDYYYCYKQTTSDWSDSELFFTGFSTGFAFGDSFVVDNQGTLHIVIGCGDTQEPLNQNPDYIDYQGLYYLNRSRNGQWSDMELLTTDLTNPSTEPSLTIDNQGILHLIYHCRNNGVYYQYRTNENGWSTRVLIPGSAPSTFYPFITTDVDNAIHVIWVHSGVEYTFKTNDSTWSDLIKITNNESNHPQLAIDINKNKHFIWTELISNESRYDLVYIYKPNNESWYAPEIICNQGPNYPHSLSIKLDDEGNIYVIWEESGNLYLRKTWENTAPFASIRTEKIPKRNANTSYLFNGTVADCEKSNSIYYFIDWGDGSNSGWIGPLNHGDKYESNHSWSSYGTYYVKTKAKDLEGAESDWSDNVTIIILNEETPGFEIFPFLFILLMVILWKKKIVCRKK